MENYLEISRAYLEISRASDLRNLKERIIYRTLEILPGFLSLTTLGFAFFFSWSRPVWAAIFIILFDIFWTLKVSYLSFHQVVSFRRMKKHLKINWQEKLKDFPRWEDIYQLVILPMARENWEVVEETLESLKSSVYPNERIIVVLAQEESGGEEAEKIGKLAQENYGKCFHLFLTTTHPQNLKGEVRGKGSNMAFAGKKIRKIIEQEKIPLKDIIVSAFDIDTKVFPQYFLCLTYHYLTAEKPERSSFQPIPLCHCFF